MLIRLTLAVATIATVGLAGCNSPPISNDDSASTSFQKPVDVDVIANDTDPDGDRLRVTQIGKPMNGSSAFKNDRTITYTPNAGFSGQDQVTYTVCDEDKEHVRNAILNISVAPEPQVAAVAPAPSHETIILPASSPQTTVVNAGTGRAPELKSETYTLSSGAPSIIARGPFLAKVLTWNTEDALRFEIGPADSLPQSLSREPVALRRGQVDFLIPDGKALFAEGSGRITLTGYVP